MEMYKGSIWYPMLHPIITELYPRINQLTQEHVIRTYVNDPIIHKSFMNGIQLE